MNLLETQGLVKEYSGRAVVNGVSVEIAQRSIVGLLGRNGAGKTTTFRMIMGMITPTQGKVIFEGVDIAELPMYKRARLGMGYLSQEPSIFQRLSVRDNLYAILETMAITNQQRNERADALIAVTDNDNANIVTAQVAKKMFALEKVFARIYDPARAQTYQKLGVNAISETALVVDSLRQLLFEKRRSVSS